MIYLYEKIMYLAGVSLTEYNKIASFIRDPLILIAALGTRGIKPTKWQVIGVIIGAFIISVIGGAILVALKVPQYNNTLNNQQNPQLQQILNKLNEPNTNQNSK